MTCLHGTHVWAMGVTPYKTGRDNCYSGAWRHLTLLVTGMLGKSVDPLERNYQTTTETLNLQLQLRQGAKTKLRK